MDFFNKQLQAVFPKDVSHEPTMSVALTVGLVVVGIVIAALCLSVCWRDYHLYLSYGPGDLPYNVQGWFISTFVLRPWSRDALRTDVYDGKLDMEKWLPDDWPRKPRSGDRPDIGPHPVPQRQLTQLSTPKIHQVRPPI